MSEKVRIVRDAIAAFNRGDVDAFVECGHPDIDFRASGRLPGVRSVQGREAVRAWCTELFDAVDVELQATQFIETADAVAATVKLITHGKRSGVALDSTLAWPGDSMRRLREPNRSPRGDRGAEVAPDAAVRKSGILR